MWILSFALFVAGVLIFLVAFGQSNIEAPNPGDGTGRWIAVGLVLVAWGAATFLIKCAMVAYAWL